MPTVYDGLFPDGTLLTARTRKRQPPPVAPPLGEPEADEPSAGR